MNVLPCHWMPPFSLFFKSGCFIWTSRCVSDHSAAISARASLSRMAALRGGALKSCPGEILAVAVCSFTVQNGLRGLQLPCGVMDNTQRQTLFYTHVHIHARELNLEISMHVHQHCKADMCALLFFPLHNIKKKQIGPNKKVEDNYSGIKPCLGSISDKVKCFKWFIFLSGLQLFSQSTSFCFLFPSSVNFTSPLLSAKA